MKKTALSLFLPTLLLACSSQAIPLTVAFSTADGSEAVSTLAGTVPNTGTPTSHIYEISNLDLNGDAVNDPVTVTIHVADGDWNPNVPSDENDDYHTPEGDDIDIGETMSFSLGSVSGTLSGSGDPITVNGFSFTVIKMRGFQSVNNDSYTITRPNASGVDETSATQLGNIYADFPYEGLDTGNAFTITGADGAFFPHYFGFSVTVETVAPTITANGKNLIWMITDEHSLRTIGAHRAILNARYPTDSKQAEMWGAGNVVHTPHLDNLAAKGAIFSSMYAATPVCTPSRASMVTGFYGAQLGMPNNSTTVEDGKFLDDSSVKTIAEVLKDAGYWTAFIGKWHLSGTAAEDNDWWSPGYPAPYDAATNPTGSYLDPSYVEISDYGWQDRRWMFNNGHSKYLGVDASGAPYRASGTPSFKDVDGDTVFYPDDLDDVDALGHPIYEDGDSDPNSFVKFTTDWLFDRAVDFIENLPDAHAPAGTDPFFLMISIPDPHTPDQAREPYASNYGGMTIEMPHTFIDDNFAGRPNYLSTNPSWIGPDAKAHKPYADYEAAVTALETPGADNFNLLDDMKQYFGMVEAIDDNIGLLISKLEAEGVLANTIIMFSSDHGDLLGEHGRLNKSSPYDMSAAIPFIVVDGSQLVATVTELNPIVPNGIVVHQAATNLDWFETFLTLLDVNIIPETPGRDLSPLLSSTPPSTWDDVDVIDGNYWVAAISDRYKLVIDNNATDSAWLFDLLLDPDELINRLNDPAYEAVARKLAQALADERAAVPDVGGPHIDTKIAELLTGWARFSTLYDLNANQLGDEDGDQVLDVLEYLLGGDPSDASSRPSIEVDVTALPSPFIYQERTPVDASLPYTAQWTDDLGGTWYSTWSSVSTSPQESGFSAIERLPNVASLGLPGGSAPDQLFYRIKLD